MSFNTLPDDAPEGYLKALRHHSGHFVHRAAADASWRMFVLPTISKNRPVFLIYRNADSMEGRGPMVLEMIVDNLAMAERYVLQQGGIFGSPQELKQSSPATGEWTYNGWSIERVLVLTQDDLVAQAAKEAKLADLRRQIEELEKA